MADTNDTARLLRRYQQWRKGEIDSFYPDSHSGPEPKEVTAAIDAAIAALEATPPADAALADLLDDMRLAALGMRDIKLNEVARVIERAAAALRALAVPKGYAGATVWIGDRRVTQIVSETEIKYERDTGNAITEASQRCLDMLAAIKEGK